MDQDITRIIDFWFHSEDATKKWLGGSPSFDAEIKTKFGSLVEQAHNSQLSTWKTKPAGALALVLLLDQLSRNIYRGTPLSFAADSQALSVSTMLSLAASTAKSRTFKGISSIILLCMTRLRESDCWRRFVGVIGREVRSGKRGIGVCGEESRFFRGGIKNRS